MRHTLVVALTSVWTTSALAANSTDAPEVDSKTTVYSPAAVLTQLYVGASDQQLAAQHEALRSAPGTRFQIDARGIPTEIFYEQKVFEFPTDIESTAGRAAIQDLLVSVRTLLLGEGTETLTQDGPETRQLHTRTIVFKESIRGIPVSDGKVAITSDDRTGKLAIIVAQFLPDRGLPTAAKLSASDAVREARAYIDREYELEARRPRVKQGNGLVARQGEGDAGLPERTGELRTRGEPSLSYRIGSQLGQIEAARLIWTVGFDPETSPFTNVLVDAVDGSIVGTRKRDTLAVGVNGCSAPPGIPTIASEPACPTWRLILYPVIGATTYQSQWSLYPSYAPSGDFHDGPGTGECETTRTTASAIAPAPSRSMPESAS